MGKAQEGQQRLKFFGCDGSLILRGPRFHYRHLLSDGLKLGHSVAERVNANYFGRDIRP